MRKMHAYYPTFSEAHRPSKRRSFLFLQLQDNQSSLSYFLSDSFNILLLWEGCPRGVMVKATVSRIVVSEFVLRSRYYVHFRANTLGKGMNPLILPPIGLNSTTTVLLGE